MSTRTVSGGLYVPLITPFDERDEVDLGAFRAIVEYVLAGGAEGLVVAGTTGEAHALSADERGGLWRAAVDQARGRVPVVAGTGATSTREARHLLRLAADCGCDAALVLTPWFERQTHESIERYYADVAEESPLPILLYHNPSRTHLEWAPEAVAAVAARLAGPVVGYKDGTADPARVAAVRAAAPRGFLIYCGAAYERAKFSEAGADGCVDELANALAAESAEAFAGIDRQMAYTAAAGACLRSSANPIALLKALMAQLGLPAGRPRRPNDLLPPGELDEMRRRVATAGRLQASPASLLLTDTAGIADRPTSAVTEAVHLLAPGLVEACLEAEPIPARRALIFRPEPGGYQYNHHAAIRRFEGRFYAAWSAGWVNEDSPGQTVLFATSDDGFAWSEAAVVMPSSADRTRWTCGQFWLREGQLWLIAHRCTRARYVDGEAVPGVCWADLVTQAFLWDGETWQPKGVICEDLYVNEGPRPLPDGTFMMTGENARHEAVVARGGATRFDDWALTVVARRTAAGKMSEPTWYATDDGTLRLLMRDDGGSRRLFLSESRDLGRSWTAPVATDFTDAQSKLVTLRLSDGRVVLVSNPSPGAVRRRLLAAAVSDDGRTFERMYAIRYDPAGQARMKGMHKVPGFDYPHAIEADGRFWVIYSVNKEDVEVCAIDPADL